MNHFILQIEEERHADINQGGQLDLIISAFETSPFMDAEYGWNSEISCQQMDEECRSVPKSEQQIKSYLQSHHVFNLTDDIWAENHGLPKFYHKTETNAKKTAAVNLVVGLFSCL